MTWLVTSLFGSTPLNKFPQSSSTRFTHVVDGVLFLFYLSRDSMFVNKRLSQHSRPLCPSSADCQSDNVAYSPGPRDSVFVNKALSQYWWPLSPSSADCQSGNLHCDDKDEVQKEIFRFLAVCITSNDRPFGCTIICTDIYSLCYFVHCSLTSSLDDRDAIFAGNFQ